MSRTGQLLLLCLVLAVVAEPAAGQARRITVVGWNVESGGAEAATIATRIRRFADVDLWGLSEVQSDAWAQLFEQAAADGEGAPFARVLGTTGGADRLAILYHTGRFELVRSFELPEINPGGTARAPLAAQLRNRASGEAFVFMVNHLHRANAQSRHRQAELLREWVRGQSLPVIAAGDYNFDWRVQNGDQDHDRGYDLLTDGGAFTWVRPGQLVRSQCAPQFDSVLDFVFVNPAARAWQASAEILVEPGDCGDVPRNPDHRPVRAVFALNVELKAQLLERVMSLEAELRRLRDLVERMP